MSRKVVPFGIFQKIKGSPSQEGIEKAMHSYIDYVLSFVQGKREFDGLIVHVRIPRDIKVVSKDEDSFTMYFVLGFDVEERNISTGLTREDFKRFMRNFLEKQGFNNYLRSTEKTQT